MLRVVFRLLLSILGFPGVAVHEFAHQLCCWLTGTRVRRVCYFRFGVPAGFVEHDAPASPWRHALISAGPLFVNTAVALACGILALREALPLDPAWKGRVLLFWLGGAAGLHAFPSMADATSLLSALWERRSGLLAKVVLTPIGGLLALGSFGTWIGLDLAWALVSVWVAPNLLIDRGWRPW